MVAVLTNTVLAVQQGMCSHLKLPMEQEGTRGQIYKSLQYPFVQDPEKPNPQNYFGKELTGQAVAYATCPSRKAR